MRWTKNTHTRTHACTCTPMHAHRFMPESFKTTCYIARTSVWSCPISILLWCISIQNPSGRAFLPAESSLMGLLIRTSFLANERAHDQAMPGDSCHFPAPSCCLFLILRQETNRIFLYPHPTTDSKMVSDHLLQWKWLGKTTEPFIPARPLELIISFYLSLILQFLHSLPINYLLRFKKQRWVSIACNHGTMIDTQYLHISKRNWIVMLARK